MSKKGSLSAALGQFDRRPTPSETPEAPQPQQKPQPAASAARPTAARRARAPQPAPRAAPEPAAKTVQPPSRQGKKALTGYFGPEVLKQLKVMAAAGDTTVQALMAEALNDLFKKHGKPHIA